MRVATQLFLPGLLLALAGCGFGNFCTKMAKSDIRVAVSIVPKANSDSPVAVDFVMACSEEVEKLLMSYSAVKWAEAKSQFEKDYQPGRDYLLVHREYVPGTSVPDVEVPLSVRSQAMFIFARYFSEGDHRYRTTVWQDIRLKLGRDGFTVEKAG